MKIGYYQYCPQFGQVNDNLDAVTARLESVECDLLVLPELAMSGYQFCSGEEVAHLAESVPNGVTTRRLSELAKKRNCHIVAGLPEEQAGKFFNSAVLVGPTGFLGVYRKVHLFFEETLFFSPGDLAFEVWDIGQARIGLLICFDWFYPEVARSLALKGADILCHPSNLVLPHCPDAMVTRSLENGVFSITANRIGEEARGGKPSLRFIGSSEIVSPKGKILHRSPRDTEELLVLDVDPVEARDKALNPYNDLLRDRRPHFYV
ncbi:MAG: acyltransferase [Nitrospirales bacterium]|nr:acyltransferase [Nitrospira sp.]MDR4500223.1 acyltransferase [Nitrospirales bacterium]